MSRIGKLPITIPENVDVNYLNSEILDKKYVDIKICQISEKFLSLVR